MNRPATQPAPVLFREVLQDLGVKHAFGLPGTQNMALFEALRGSRVQVVVPTHELAAAFMANGYHRVSGRNALVLTIRGPGFAYTLPGMAEAALDSAGLVQLTTTAAVDPERRYLSQAIDQSSMARPITKAIFEILEAKQLSGTLVEAFRTAGTGEPGPVLIQLDPSCLDEDAEAAALSVEPTPCPGAEELKLIADEMAAAQRPLLFLGQGCVEVSAEAQRLAERLGAAVLSTSSGRGVIPEQHPLSLGFQFAGTRAEAMNELVERSDLVLALGCRFSQNGARGFRFEIPEDKLIHVDRSAATLGANYPARRQVHSDAGEFLRALLEQLGEVAEEPRPWSSEELESWRERGRTESWLEVPEPTILGGHPSEFFNALRRVLPDDSHLVTDSGLHQLLARRYYRVDGPAGLVMPTGFQSMGFGLPAAIGAKLARPEPTVAALIGDGGLLMSGMELITAAKLGLDLCVLVINDASYGLIRRSQESAYGTAPSSELPVPDYEALATALQTNYVRLGRDAESGLREALALGGVTLVEIASGDSPQLRVARAKGKLKRALGARALRALRGILSS